jgi:hypothetical protein
MRVAVVQQVTPAALMALEALEVEVPVSMPPEPLDLALPIQVAVVAVVDKE